MFSIRLFPVCSTVDRTGLRRWLLTQFPIVPNPVVLANKETGRGLTLPVRVSSHRTNEETWHGWFKEKWRIRSKSKSLISSVKNLPRLVLQVQLQRACISPATTVEKMSFPGIIWQCLYLRGNCRSSMRHSHGISSVTSCLISADKEPTAAS